MIVLFSKKVILKWVGVPDFWEGQVEKQSEMQKNGHFLRV